MRKQIKTLGYVIIILCFGCKNGIMQTFTIIEDLREEFQIHAVELSQDMNGQHLTFLLRDLDFSEFTENELKTKATEIHTYVITNYPELSTAETIGYDFTSPVDVGYVVFNVKREIIDFTFL
ncbi:hypothetical protein [Mangrovimonas sp. TPBH4]|uniref:hypothetical protein n=1 Tax=Mangrovimonas sp. TPBH4 TaxID=1645914 RepID=UPI0006B40CAE|nr:hypothetical protein [Mangrovimonas sp. TPBH4]